MEKGLRYAGAIPSLARKATAERVDSALASLALLDRSAKVRRLTDLAMTGIGVEPLPPALYADHATILVSNYPSVSQSLRAVIKVGCRLSPDEPRLKAIARPEIVTQANLPMKVLGVSRFVFPVHKDEAGAYRLQRKLVKEVLVWLDGPGHVLWLSITGRTRGNGLLEGDLRTGAALFALNRRVPLLPMGLVTKERKGRLRVVKVRFGDPIYPPSTSELDDFERADYLIDLTKLAMSQVALLLPSGQRGDFENAGEKLTESRRRLGLD